MRIAVNTQLLVVSLYPMGARFWAMFLTSRRRSGLYPVMVAFAAYCCSVYWAWYYMEFVIHYWSIHLMHLLLSSVPMVWHEHLHAAQSYLALCVYIYIYIWSIMCASVFLCMADRFVVTLSCDFYIGMGDGHLCIPVCAWFCLVVGVKPFGVTTILVWMQVMSVIAIVSM